MALPTFRKTLLALAMTTATPGALANTLQLTNAGYHSTEQTYAGPLTLTGSYQGSAAQQAVFLQGATVPGNLVLDATISNTASQATGVTLGEWFQPPQWTPTRIDGDLVQQGSISVQGAGATALLLDPALITGNVINRGLLSAQGEPLTGANGRQFARALYYNGDTQIDGDLINAASGRILASGSEARGVSLEGQSIKGRMINQGLIQVDGTNAVALDAPTSSWVPSYSVELAGIDNSGTIDARGVGAMGIVLDGATMVDSNGVHLNNSGTVHGQGAGIVIRQVAFDGQGLQPWYKDHGDLNLYNNGTISSEGRAIDASQANRPVELILRTGSHITGNLIDVANIEVEGDTWFTGTDASHDGTNIRLKPNGLLEVGNLVDGLATTFTLGAPHTSLQGDLFVAGNSALAMGLGNDTDPARPVLTVSGNAQFEQGAKVLLSARGNDFRASGSRYTLVDAGQLQVLDPASQAVLPNGSVSVSSTSALLDVDSSAIQGNQLVAVVTTRNSQTLNQIIDQQGGSSRAKGALGTLMQDGVLGKLADNDPLLQAASHLDEAQMTKLAEQLAPETNGGATQAATGSQRLISTATSARTSSLRGVASGDGYQQTGVWVQTLYSDATQGSRDGIAGYNAYSHGIAVGADGMLSDQLTLGVAYSFIDSEVNGRTGNTTQVDSHAFTLYGGYELGDYFVDASMTYGFNDNQGKRDIAGTRAKADYDSDLLGLNLVGGYSWHVAPQLLIEPRLAARYSRVDIDGYREKGSSAALKVEDQRYETLELGAGVRVAASYAAGAGTLEPQAKVMAYHDFAADQVSSTSTFLLGNTPFVTHGANAVRDSYEAGVGVDYKVGAVTLGLNYDYIGKSGFDADVFSAKARYDF